MKCRATVWGRFSSFLEKPLDVSKIEQAVQKRLDARRAIIRRVLSKKAINLTEHDEPQRHRGHRENI
jgi:hypothetical protein